MWLKIAAVNDWNWPVSSFAHRSNLGPCLYYSDPVQAPPPFLEYFPLFPSPHLPFPYSAYVVVNGVLLRNLIWSGFKQLSYNFQYSRNVTVISIGGLGRLDCQVGRLVRRPGGPPRQMLKEGVWNGWGVPGPFARKGGGSTCFDKLYAGVPEFLVTPLLMGPVYLICHGRFVKPSRTCL